MARHAQLRDLYSRPFLREIHHLLWMDSSAPAAGIDGGWNCRDHAWVTTLLSLALGHTATLVTGEVFFSSGSSARFPAATFSVKPHSWAWVHGVGVIDLSVKPLSRIGGNDYRVPIKCIFAGEWIPRGRNNAYFFDDPARFERAVESLSSQRRQAACVYLATEGEYPHAGHMTHAAGWTCSALTNWLDAKYGNPSDIYAAMLLHLRAFLESGARSLANLPFEKAWAVIADERHGAIDRATRYVGERAVRHAAFHHDRPAAVPA